MISAGNARAMPSLHNTCQLRTRSRLFFTENGPFGGRKLLTLFGFHSRFALSITQDFSLDKETMLCAN